MSNAVVVPKSWRSEIWLFAIFCVLCGVSIGCSWTLPGSLIEGPLLPLGKYRIMLKLPLFWLLPAGTIFLTLFRLYNVRYLVDESGVEGRVGVLWTSQQISRVRYEDIVGIETRQTLLQRFLDVGDIEIGTAATGGVEVIFGGVAAPYEVMQMIQAERTLREEHGRGHLLNASPVTSGA